MSVSAPAIAPGAAAPSRRARLAHAWRAFWAAARLGWKAEANWTDPLLFFIYSFARPVAGALILVVMLDVVSGGRIDPTYRAYVVAGSALWAFVTAGIAGTAWSVLDDRERYRMLKYLYTSPNSFLMLLVARGAARLTSWGAGSVVTLALGIVFLGLPFDPARIDWPLLLLVMVIGLTGVVAVGVVLGAVVMQTRQDSWQYPEAVAGALFLVTGAVFPIVVLPPVAQWVGLAVPLTWWLEGVRQALFPGAISGIGGPGSLFAQLTGRAAPGPTELLVGLLVTTLLVTLAAVATYRVSERRARERGLFDLTTGS